MPKKKTLKGIEDPRLFYRWKDRFMILGLFVGAFWLVESIDTFTSLLSIDLDRHGIIPRETYGLKGILFAPFLHGDWNHLIGNTLPFVVLGILVLSLGVTCYLGVTFLVMLIAGFGTWFFGSTGTHVGASGIVFGYLGFVLSRGIFIKSVIWIIIGLIVGIFYSWMVTSLFKVQEGISWVGHAFGFGGGVLASWLFASKK